MMPEAKLIILEGFKETSYPKIEVIRGANSNKPASNPENRIALVSDLGFDCGLPVFGLNDIEEIADFIAVGVNNGRFC